MVKKNNKSNNSNNSNSKIPAPYTLNTLTRKVYKDLPTNSYAMLFCFGDSLVSRLIMAKTRLEAGEIVPSHTAIAVRGNDGIIFIYESTSFGQKIHGKCIPAGVRRYLFSDFKILEKDKSTTYYLATDKTTTTIDSSYELERWVGYPYGIDSIIDFALKDDSDGESNGLICSQYANKVFRLMRDECPSPAELWRILYNEE